MTGDPATWVLTVTEVGRAAHAEISARVNEIRELILRGLTPDQYTETVNVLATMATNIE